jgi:hypothetical protein
VHELTILRAEPDRERSFIVRVAKHGVHLYVASSDFKTRRQAVQKFADAGGR